MYTLHFGHGQEHTQLWKSPGLANMPFYYTGWASSSGAIEASDMWCNNGQIISHKEIFERYGVKGGHGEYCLEIWNYTGPTLGQSCCLPIGGYGDLTEAGAGNDLKAFYLKFDFMYTPSSNGDIITIQRSTFAGTVCSIDLTLTLVNGYLEVYGVKHLTPSDPPRRTAWLPNNNNRHGSIYLKPNKWHEIQIFIDTSQGWHISEIGPDLLGYAEAPDRGFLPFFSAFEHYPASIPLIYGAETSPHSDPNMPLQVNQWPINGHPKYPNTMLPEQNQQTWPPENFASGQYFYGDNLGLVYVWVNGKLDIQHSTNMANEQDGWDSLNTSKQKIYFGNDVNVGSHFFYDNIMMNDIRNPSGSYPSKIFNPLFSSGINLEWNPGYSLKFIAMQMNSDYWRDDHLGTKYSRKHNAWLPEYPRGALIPSGDPYWVNAPQRYGAPTDSMIPHGTKLTIIHIDWDGESKYTAYDGWGEITTSGEQYPIIHTGNPDLYPDYDTDFRYQHLQPQESNPIAVNLDDPHIISGRFIYRDHTYGEEDDTVHKQLFYLKRPPATSGQPPFPIRHPEHQYYGKQPLGGGYGLGGVINYLPNIHPAMGNTVLPPIYRIWTCIQDMSMGSEYPCDKQYHMIRIPSGISGIADFLSDNSCPGDIDYRAYQNTGATISNGISTADWPYNPITGDPWTWEDIDTLQIGVCHSGHIYNNHVITYTLYLVIEHGSTIDPEIDILGDNLLEWAVADDIPYHIARKSMHMPRLKPWTQSKSTRYYNRWITNPVFTINRTDTQTTDDQIAITNPVYSGVIKYDYKIRWPDGEVVVGPQYRIFDEHYDNVWVYTCDLNTPSGSSASLCRKGVITDANGDHFSFLGHPVLQWNTQKDLGREDAFPKTFPYVIFDYNTLYIIPLSTHSVADTIDPDEVSRTWIDPSIQPSSPSGCQWTINNPMQVFNFAIDPDSYFNTFSPSSVINYALTFPNAILNDTFPISRNQHDSYFRAPDLPSGSVYQTIHLTDKLGIPEIAIDHGLYEANIGLYQTTANQLVNDTGEGRFDFYSGDPDIDTFISGYTFGPDGTAGWHLNETTILVPSGTRQVRFTFHAIQNTEGPKSPGSTLGGTSNFAAFDEPFFILNMIQSYTADIYHPADGDQNNQIINTELIDYINQWQSGVLSLGQAKDYLTKAEHIWQSGVSTVLNEPSGGIYFDAKDGPKPENWMGSGSI